jgi:hypothetical protein
VTDELERIWKEAVVTGISMEGMMRTAETHQDNLHPGPHPNQAPPESTALPLITCSVTYAWNIKFVNGKFHQF